MGLRGILAAVMDFIYPPHCPACGAYVEHCGAWCPDCLAKAVCVKRLPLDCDTAKWVDGAYALGKYHGSLRDLIRGLKYHQKMGNLLQIRAFLDACDAKLPFLQNAMVAVPVPLHKDKLRSRGYNQAERIFRDWLEAKGIAVHEALCRTRVTVPQYGLSREERRKNMMDAFSVTQEEFVCGKEVLLLDDIMTTGATVQACAEALRRKGAVRVLVMVLASDRRQR